MKGLGYYRNRGVYHSNGSIIIFIDDDEQPVNNNWLNNLIFPIINGNEKVTVSGYNIPLNQGYIADSISFLGFPGGGCIGFKNMWHVDDDDYTYHLSGGNFAIDKDFLNEIGGFNDKLKFGSEDIELSNKIIKAGGRIKYIEDAIVIHEARKEFIDFIKWNIKRGRAIREFKKLDMLRNPYLDERFKSFKKTMKKTVFTKYFPMVLFLFFNQYLWNLFGYMIDWYYDGD